MKGSRVKGHSGRIRKVSGSLVLVLMRTAPGERGSGRPTKGPVFVWLVQQHTPRARVVVSVAPRPDAAGRNIARSAVLVPKPRGSFFFLVVRLWEFCGLHW